MILDTLLLDCRKAVPRYQFRKVLVRETDNREHHFN